MRLIDADDINFRKKFCRRFCTNLADVETCDATCHIMQWIDEQPTAYDVDKIKNELLDGIDDILYDRCYDNDYQIGISDVKTLLTDVFKEGGQNE